MRRYPLLWIPASLQITIERRSGKSWPVIAEYRPAGFQLASRKEGELHLGGNWQAELLARDLDREAYGQFLGQALFQNQIRDAFMHTRGQAAEHLRLLLVIEDAALRSLHWERLCAPIGPGGRYSLLALDKQLLPLHRPRGRPPMRPTPPNLHVRAGRLAKASQDNQQLSIKPSRPLLAPSISHY